MDTEKEENIIRDIIKVIIDRLQDVRVGDKVNDVFAGIAFNLYKTGYRKADEVEKQTARDIATWLETNVAYNSEILYKIARAIRLIWQVEVDE